MHSIVYTAFYPQQDWWLVWGSLATLICYRISTQIHAGGLLSFGLCTGFSIGDRLYVFISLNSTVQLYNVEFVVTYCMFDMAGIFHFLYFFTFSIWFHTTLSVSMVHWCYVRRTRILKSNYFTYLLTYFLLQGSGLLVARHRSTLKWTVVQVLVDVLSNRTSVESKWQQCLRSTASDGQTLLVIYLFIYLFI